LHIVVERIKRNTEHRVGKI